MKTTFVSILFAVLFLVPVSNAQQNQNLATQTIMPMVVVADMHFALSVLNTIEIKGDQVNAFLDIKNLFAGAIEYAQEKKLKMTDAFRISTTYAVGKNTMFFMEKVTLSGANAEQYKRLTGAFELELLRIEQGKPLEQPSN